VPVTSAVSNVASVSVSQLTITVTQSSNGQISSGTTTVNYGDNQTFTITPNTGYSIASLTVDGSPVTAASSYTFSNIEASHTITATFTINTYTITVTQGDNGVIAPGTTTINFGGNQTFTITANTGYYIADVSVNGSSVDAVSSYTFTNVQAAYTISATFALTPTP